MNVDILTTAQKLQRLTININGVIVGEISSSGDPQKDMTLVAAFLKDKNLQNDISIAKVMFGQAVSFCRVAFQIYDQDLRTAQPNQMGAVPFAVNASFSIEIYLKTLLTIYGIRVPRSHDLSVLYQLLEPQAQDSILAIAGKQAPLLHLASVSADEFQSYIAQLSNTFEEWRYFYETGKTNLVGFQTTRLVMIVLDQACRSTGKVG